MYFTRFMTVPELTSNLKQLVSQAMVQDDDSQRHILVGKKRGTDSPKTASLIGTQGISFLSYWFLLMDCIPFSFTNGILLFVCLIIGLMPACKNLSPS